MWHGRPLLFVESTLGFIFSVAVGTPAASAADPVCLPAVLTNVPSVVGATQEQRSPKF
jgi:hypothetical protein